ncbi:type I toxin-antitoxin system Fst family toxin [Candidatus Stoquefichus massiliensis]
MRALLNEIFISIITSVIAGIILYYICKWLDKK